METKFHDQFYRTEPKITIGDLAKVVQESGKSVERYMARFRTERTKYATVMSKRDCVKFV